MIVAITMVRDEADVIWSTLRHLLAEGVDHIIVADNLSTDETPDLLRDLAEFGAPLTVLEDSEPGYYQDRKMSHLADLAADMGATWVLPFDADEIWYTPSGSTISDALGTCTAEIISARGWDHIATPSDAHDLDPFVRMVHRRDAPQKLPKVAFRAMAGARLHMGNHDVDRPGERQSDLLAFRHFQYRSFPQMCHKVRTGCAAYEASDLHFNYGTHWRTLGSLDDETLFAHWQDLCSEEGLIVDPAPLRETW